MKYVLAVYEVFPLRPQPNGPKRPLHLELVRILGLRPTYERAEKDAERANRLLSVIQSDRPETHAADYDGGRFQIRPAEGAPETTLYLDQLDDQAEPRCASGS